MILPLVLMLGQLSGSDSLGREEPLQLYQNSARLGQVSRLNCIPPLLCARTGFGTGTGSVKLNGLTTVGADDQTLVSNGTIWEYKTLPSCSATSSALQYTQATNTYSCGAISSNAVEVSVTMPSDESGWAQAVVTGQAWVTSTSKIACQPFNDNSVTDNNDEVYSLAQFAESVSTRVVGTGFTLTVASPNGPTGVFKFHCIGV